MGALIVDFGVKDKVRTYRICGTKEEIVKLLDGAREDGYKFHDTPNLLKVYRGQWTVVIYFKVEDETNDKIH